MVQTSPTFFVNAFGDKIWKYERDISDIDYPELQRLVKLKKIKKRIRKRV
jgi:hypothetical protein